MDNAAHMLREIGHTRPVIQILSGKHDLDGADHIDQGYCLAWTI